MTKAMYWQRGETLDFPNTGTAIIEAGTIINLGTRIGVVGTDINPKEIGSLHVTGIYKMPKVADEEITMGELLYCTADGEITKVETDNAPVGYAAAESKITDTVVLVKLLG